MYFIIDVIYIFVLLAYLPGLYFKKKLHSGYKMRMGGIPPELQAKLANKENIWVHAISVGEVLAIGDLIEKLNNEYPQHQIICSVVTQTGYKLAQEHLDGKAVVIYAPLDFSWVVKKYISMIQPKIYIFAETEIWPNLFRQLGSQGVPMIQVNGRISEKSMRGYQRIRKTTRSALRRVDKFCMQTQLDADRIQELGAIPERVRVIGNLKFDNLPEEVELSKREFGFSDADQCLIAGSTHPGEEKLIITAFKQLQQVDGTARLILCPRHIERASDVMDVVTAQGLKPIAFSDAKGHTFSAGEVLVVDTIGQLRNLYSLAKLVIIGKTFCVGGGQNMLEPAFFGKPIIVGPLTSNFKDIVELLRDEKAIVQIESSDELAQELMDIWTNAVRTESLGLAAKRVVEKYQGATGRTLDEVKGLLSGVQR